MSIRNKLLLGFSSVLLFTLVGFLVLYYSLQSIGNSYKNLAEQEVVKLNLAQNIRFEDLMLADAIKGIIIEPDSEVQLNLYNEYSEKISTDIAAVKKLIKDERAINIFKEMDENNQQLIDLESQMIELAKIDKERTIEIYNGDYQEIREIFSSNLEDFEEIQEEIMAKAVEEGTETIAQRSLISIVVIIVSIVLSIVISLYIARIITKPLQIIVNKLTELSSNEGDLTARLSITSKDEFGKLSNAFNIMVENIQQIIKQVQRTTAEVAASSEELYSSSEQNSEATNQITISIQEIASGADKQVLSTEDSLTALSNISSGIQKVAESSQSVEVFAYETTEKAENGNLVISRTLKQMDIIQKTVANAGTKVQELGELSTQVGEIVEVITAIADQTNLLALNAAIEAARAGESGKGFAVVADEVRKLAEQSKDSASKITTLISSIQKNTSLAVESTHKGMNEVNEGILVVNEASRAFNAILNSVKEVAEKIQEVSASSQQMSAGAEQVTTTMGELSNISKEASISSQTVASASEQQLASMEEITSSAGNLSKMAIELESVVGKFKV